MDQQAEQRLAALSPEAVEQVIRRALQLQDADRQQAVTRLSPQDLEAIAGELGVPDRYVRRALEEVLAAGPPRPQRGVERLLAPRRLGGGRVVDAAPDVAAAAVASWLRRDEGLVLRGRSGSGERWEPDRHLLTAIRQGLRLGRGTGTLRGLPGGVTARVVEVRPGRQLVAVEADTSVVTRAGVAVAAGGTALGGVVGAVVASGMPGGNDLLQALAGFAPVAGVGLVAARVTARTWLRRVRHGLERALDGIALVADGREADPTPSGGLRALARDLFGRWG